MALGTGIGKLYLLFTQARDWWEWQSAHSASRPTHLLVPPDAASKATLRYVFAEINTFMHRNGDSDSIASFFQRSVGLSTGDGTPAEKIRPTCMRL